MDAMKTYALNRADAVSCIARLGHKISYVIEGDQGIGKSALMHDLQKLLPEHVLCYFDCNTKDVADAFVPDISSAQTENVVRMVPNAEFGIQHGKPIILMIDEIAKAEGALKRALNGVFHERKIGLTPLPEGSIVFGTTNLSSENLGDVFEPHTIDRVCRVRMRKPSNMEWLEWGINNNIHPTVLGWVKDNPQLFHSFDDVASPSDNLFIYHPNEVRDGWVTPRGLEKSSDIIHESDFIGDMATRSSLIGTIGAHAAGELMAFVTLFNQIPSHEEILESPDTAIVPTDAAAACMVVARALVKMQAKDVSKWMKYLNRLDKGAQVLFGLQAKVKDYKHQQAVVSNKDFSAWALNNSHIFSADKK